MPMVSSKTEVLILFFLVKLISNTGVFRFDSQANHGNTMYHLYLEKQSLCLRACYDEKECKVAEYNETNGFCRLYRQGNTGKVKGYELTREDTDSSCMTETFTSDIAFQKIKPLQEIPKTSQCQTLAKSDKTVIKTFKTNEGYRVFFTNSPPEWNATKPWLVLSKKAEKGCASVPVFHKANHRRLYFGEIYNTTGYYFFDGYAFAEQCISSKGECLGMSEIREYKENPGNFFYDEAGRNDMEDSGLGQNFYIAGIASYR
ncbi:unnamed protein product [Cylicocyclus nassatus]|uniref:Apple domain-containing protein n=1 Tax=Cylicocyclus nassatus TaxID=53992 RepID=A0AA36H024_CYLNA|nr:unnamed protein product [Cylicocyclus nassatus]